MQPRAISQCLAELVHLSYIALLCEGYIYTSSVALARVHVRFPGATRVSLCGGITELVRQKPAFFA